MEAYNSAISDYTYLIEQLYDPDNAYLYFVRGYTYARNKRYELAIKDYNQAIELNPNDASYYFQRGNALADSGDFPNAIMSYTKGLELQPNEAYWYAIRGFTRFSEGRRN